MIKRFQSLAHWLRLLALLIVPTILTLAILTYLAPESLKVECNNGGTFNVSKSEQEKLEAKLERLGLLKAPVNQLIYHIAVTPQCYLGKQKRSTVFYSQNSTTSVAFGNIYKVKAIKLTDVTKGIKSEIANYQIEGDLGLTPDTATGTIKTQLIPTIGTKTVLFTVLLIALVGFIKLLYWMYYFVTKNKV